MKQLLVITNSFDLTTDLLLDRLPAAVVFRFNFDQFASYSFALNATGFELSDPTGRKVNSRSVRKAYWRKPFNGPTVDPGGESTTYAAAELRYALSELVNLLWIDRRLVLVEPFAEQRVGKLIQLAHARSYFHVPAYEFLLNRRSALEPAVVKSLSNELIGEGVLYTTRVSARDLSPAFPWLIQEEVHALEDVTVVYVRGKLFGFSLKRDFLNESPDWRRFVSPDQQWRAHALPVVMQDAVRQYMESLQLDYGRLDFLLDCDGLYWFCEVNPNGQFAWIDLADEHGLLSAIVDEISPQTEVRPLSNRHALERGKDTRRSARTQEEHNSDCKEPETSVRGRATDETVTARSMHRPVGEQ